MAIEACPNISLTTVGLTRAANSSVAQVVEPDVREAALEQCRTVLNCQPSAGI